MANLTDQTEDRAFVLYSLHTVNTSFPCAAPPFGERHPPSAMAYPDVKSHDYFASLSLLHVLLSQPFLDSLLSCAKAALRARKAMRVHDQYRNGLSDGGLHTVPVSSFPR